MPLQFTVYNGANHDEAALRFEPAAIEFLSERFAGVPFTGNCASVGVGNSLAPLPMPASGQPAAQPSPATANQPAREPQAAPTRASGALAYTGEPTAVPLAAGIFLLVALAGLLVRRQGSWPGRASNLGEDVHGSGGHDGDGEQRNQ